MFAGEVWWGGDEMYGMESGTLGRNRKRKSGTCPCQATRDFHPPSCPFPMDAIFDLPPFFLAVVGALPV